jgi:hypothetical protein
VEVGDITIPACLTTVGSDLGLTVTPGFDDVTGIGTAFRRF